MIVNEPNNCRTIDHDTGDLLTLVELRRDQNYYLFKLSVDSKEYRFGCELQRLDSFNYEYVVSNVYSAEACDQSILEKLKAFINVYKDSYAGDELGEFNYAVRYDTKVN